MKGDISLQFQTCLDDRVDTISSDENVRLK
jgi:hypothetical protein